MSEEEDEQESDALERLKGELGEKFETELHNLQAIQVINFSSFFITHKVTFEYETKEIWFMLWFLFNISKEMYFRAVFPFVSTTTYNYENKLIRATWKPHRVKGSSR